MAGAGGREGGLSTRTRAWLAHAHWCPEHRDKCPGSAMGAGEEWLGPHSRCGWLEERQAGGCQSHASTTRLSQPYPERAAVARGGRMVASAAEPAARSSPPPSPVFCIARNELAARGSRRQNQGTSGDCGRVPVPAQSPRTGDCRPRPERGALAPPDALTGTEVEGRRLPIGVGMGRAGRRPHPARTHRWRGAVFVPHDGCAEYNARHRGEARIVWGGC